MLIRCGRFEGREGEVASRQLRVARGLDGHEAHGNMAHQGGRSGAGVLGEWCWAALWFALAELRR